MSATPEHGGLSDEDAACVEAALRAVDAYDADPTGAQIGHWPTVAGWLMVEVRRLRALRAGVEGLAELSEAATPGGPRWETAPDEMHGPSQAVIYPADSDSAVAFAGTEDAAFITACVNLVRALLDDPAAAGRAT